MLGGNFGGPTCRQVDKGNDMRSSTALGTFVLDSARGQTKILDFPRDQAQQVRDQLSEKINSRVEEIRNSQRRAFEESKSITIF